MVHRHLAQGARIFLEGEASDAAYLIENGFVEIAVGNGPAKRVLSHLGPGRIFGEMGLIDGGPRSASATALTAVELIVIDEPQILDRLRDSDPVVVHLLCEISERLRRVLGTVASPLAGPSLVGYEEVVERLREEAAIRQGVSERAFIPFYQPIVDLATLAVRGVEALARWRKADGGIETPGGFIPAAERTRVIRAIDLLILERACAHVAELNRGVPPADALFVSANFSPLHFSDTGVVSAVAGILDRTGLPPALLKAEITERVLIDGEGAAGSVIDDLRRLGVAIALDDFGTGYSSLSILHRYPIDTLKIDRSFLSSERSASQRLQLLGTIVRLGKAFGMTVVVEGVETGEQLAEVRAAGCDLGQGYFFGRPMPSAAIFATPADAVCDL